MSPLFALSFPAWHFVFRAAVVYAAVIVLLRLGGKRQVGQMGTGDLVALLLISNAVQNSMNGGDNSITGGLILACVIILISVALDYLTYKSKRLESLIEGTPRLLVHHGRVIDGNLAKERLNAYDLRIRLRHQGIHSLDEVEQAVLESDGSLSVIKKGELPPRTEPSPAGH